MKRILNMLFRKKEENPFYSKLKKILSGNNKVEEIVSAFYLGGFAYNENLVKELETVVCNNELDLFLRRNPYDTQLDNIELYWIMDKSNNPKIFVVFDPVELFQKEELVDTLFCNGSLPNTFSLKEIYSIK